MMACPRSAESDECRIDAIAQSWSSSAVLVTLPGLPGMQSVWSTWCSREPPFLLFTPPFEPNHRDRATSGLTSRASVRTAVSKATPHLDRCIAKLGMAAALVSCSTAHHPAATPRQGGRNTVWNRTYQRRYLQPASPCGRGGWTWYTGRLPGCSTGVLCPARLQETRQQPLHRDLIARLRMV